MLESVQGIRINWDQFGAVISAVGALGIASFGVTEALGKAFAFTVSFPHKRTLYHWGLPYVGLGVVKRMIHPLAPALLAAYGEGFLEIIAQQYRSDRSAGRAPDTIRQGVRLGLPFLSVEAAATMIGSVWRLKPEYATALATGLQADSSSDDPAASSGGPTTPGANGELQLLAGRFATSLDARVNSAFSLAEERYESVAKLASGVTAVVLACGFNMGLHYPLFVAAGIGLVAVPLAPVAKDLSTSLQNALTAFRSIPSVKI